jgi:4-hydroxy-tetrahydrodipicolinate synthase
MTVPFRGIYPMVYAFFGADGRLDRAAMRRQVKGCLAAGAHGIAALGLATEVGKLAPEERDSVMAWVLEDVGGRVPVAITIYGADPAEQIRTIRRAAALGASWVILQPPPGVAPDETALRRFFGSVMAASPVPVAIQNAPQYLGVGLSDAALLRLCREHGCFRLLKGEGSALQIRATIEALDGRLAVFNGRGGLELTDNLRAGCAGMIPAPECCDVQAEIFALMAKGGAAAEAAAERRYAEILPLITFLMQSIDQFLCYGKRLTARRLCLGEVHDRPPCKAPTAFGQACLERHASMLGPLG